MNLVDINLNETRSTVINWPNHVKQIVDGYRSYHTIAHGIQKDAIQNSWDARIDKSSATNWGIIFELVETKDITLISFTDFGTTGLTGRVLKPEELELDLPSEERWGRFENVAFTKDPKEKSLGARGRGKFIFLGASDHKATTNDGKSIGSLLLYDTLKFDGSYRFGFRTITTTDSPIDDFDNEIGIEKLNYFTKGLLSKPKQVGTRVIIVNPKKDVVEEFKNGKLENYIRETWWEILKDYNAHISIKINDATRRIKINEHFNFPEKDSDRFKVWIKANVKLPGAPSYLIKKLHIVYDGQGIAEEDLRGIFIQRGGMKVHSLKVNYLEKSISDSIYGYIKLDEDLENKIKEDEGIEHYSYDFKKLIPKLIKQFVEDESERFIREKLGIDTISKSKNYEKDRSAEKKAIYQINKVLC
ncbi:MAG: hypothetical protein HYV29_11140 [Ignavibacteriales bacterium]|nr:hypothetical protein [Ignavibacteriales bacterium]